MKLRKCISIHAAQEGCDIKRCDSPSPLSNFNPRSPRGLRRVVVHAVQEFGNDFNPRSPRGLRPLVLLYGRSRLCISIHAAQEGCDRTRSRKFAGRCISIHAAQEGCDSIRINCNYYSFYSYKSAKLTFLLN